MDIFCFCYFLEDLHKRSNLDAKSGEGEETPSKRGQIVRVGTLETSEQGGRVTDVGNLKTLVKSLS